MITKSWHCIFVDPYLHIWSFSWVFLGVPSLRRVIEVSSSGCWKSPEAEISQPLLIPDKPISDPFQSLAALLLRSGDNKSSWRHLDVSSSLFWSLLWSSYDRLRSLHPSTKTDPPLLITSPIILRSSQTIWWSSQTICREATLCCPLLPQVDLAPLSPFKGWIGVYMFEELECPWLE